MSDLITPLSRLSRQRYGMVRSEAEPGSPTETPMDTTTTTRLADAMDRRRIELGKAWEAVAREAGVSTTFLRKYRRGGTGARDLTKARLEGALRWAPGSIDAILDGGQPTPIAHEIPTLGEILIQRGILDPDDVTSVEDIRDPGVIEILEMSDLDEETKNSFLVSYMRMRRQIIAEYRR